MPSQETRCKDGGEHRSNMEIEWTTSRGQRPFVLASDISDFIATRKSLPKSKVAWACGMAEVRPTHLTRQGSQESKRNDKVFISSWRRSNTCTGRETSV